jgi:glycosyltransferase involved in cell wall biosynthesis
MKILHVCHEPLPSHHTNTEQTVRTAAALATEGAQVDLLCPVPSHQQPGGWERIAAFYGITKPAGNGLRIMELPGPRWCRGNALRPWLDFAAGRFGRDAGYDFQLVRDPLALTTSLRAGRRTVFDSYRYDLHSELRYWPWRAYCYRHHKLAGFIAHSEIARQAVLSAGVVPDRTLLAHNGIDPRLMEPRMSKADARRRLGLSRDRSVVVYAGRVGPDKGTDGILSLARALPEVEFLMVGHIRGSAPSVRLSRSISSLGLENVRLVERVPPVSVAPYLFAADCLLVPLSAAPVRRHKRTVLPLKIFLYMAAGRPILAPRTPDVAEVLRDEHNALLVEPDNVTAAVLALRRLLGDSELQDRLAQNSLADTKKHSWSSRARKIVEFLSSLM